MAGGCCCSVEDSKSAITAFGAMNIVIFAACLIVCSKEFHSLKLIASYPDRFSPEIIGKFDMKHTSALISAIVLSVFGIIAGIVLLCEPKRKGIHLSIVWIVFECIAIITMLIFGGLIIRVRGGILYSSLFLLSSCPFLLWSVISACISLQGPSYAERRQNIAHRKRKHQKHHVKAWQLDSTSVSQPHPTSTVIQMHETDMYICLKSEGNL